MNLANLIKEILSIRSIKFTEPDEDTLDQEIENAFGKSMEQRLYENCQHIKFNYAMAGIDVQTFPVTRIIYYIDEERH